MAGNHGGLMTRSCAANVQKSIASAQSRDKVQGTRYPLPVPLGTAVEPSP